MKIDWVFIFITVLCCLIAIVGSVLMTTKSNAGSSATVYPGVLCDTFGTPPDGGVICDGEKYYRNQEIIVKALMQQTQLGTVCHGVDDQYGGGVVCDGRTYYSHREVIEDCKESIDLTQYRMKPVEVCRDLLTMGIGSCPDAPEFVCYVRDQECKTHYEFIKKEK